MTGRPGSARRGGSRVLSVVSMVSTAVLVVLSTGWGVPAAAHISLLSSDPAAGERLDVMPTQVRLEFSEPVSAPAYVLVTGPDGARNVDDVRIDGATVTAVLDAGSDGSDGAHAVSFRVVSRDGHPVSGRLDFVVGEAGTVPDPAPDPEAAPPDGTAARGGAARASGGDDGWSLGHVQVGVALGLFGLSGLLLIASAGLPVRRRGPGGDRR